jgi:hypothetical protein
LSQLSSAIKLDVQDVIRCLGDGDCNRMLVFAARNLFRS